MEPNKTDSALIVMPAWNESEAIPGTIREIQSTVPEHDILVVDDGSSDDTVERARAEGVMVLVLPYNLGVGGAMRAGFKFALAHGYTRVIQVDSDGQHNPADINRVLDGLANADICIGARFAGEGSYQAKGLRRAAMVVLAGVISRIAGTKLTDVTSGFKAVNLKGLKQFISHFPAEYLGDTIDSLVVAIKSGCVVTQVPVSMRERQGGTPSHSPLKAAIYLGRSGLVLLLALAKRSAPKQSNPEVHGQ